MVGALVTQERVLQERGRQRSASPRTNRLTNDDWRLIQSCKNGDRKAWDRLIGKYERSVYRFAYSLSRNHDDAADIAGQVFVRLYEHIHSFRHDSHFTSWLFFYRPERLCRHMHPPAPPVPSLAGRGHGYRR